METELYISLEPFNYFVRNCFRDKENWYLTQDPALFVYYVLAKIFKTTKIH